MVVYTAILGEYDMLYPPCFVAPDVRYICFSERPRAVPPWETQPFPQALDTPARNSRIPRCLPHLLIDSDYSIYHDGAFRLNCDPAELVAHLGDADLALFRHPFGHQSIHDERKHYITHRGGVPPDIESQYRRYVAEGLPNTGQFWAGGIVIRRHCSAVERFNELWFREYVAGSSNDQFALYAAVIKSGVTVATIEGNITGDERFPYHGHAWHEPEGALWLQRMRRIRQLADES